MNFLWYNKISNNQQGYKTMKTLLITVLMICIAATGEAQLNEQNYQGIWIWEQYHCFYPGSTESGTPYYSTPNGKQVTPADLRYGYIMLSTTPSVIEQDGHALAKQYRSAVFITVRSEYGGRVTVNGITHIIPPAQTYRIDIPINKQTRTYQKNGQTITEYLPQQVTITG
jgi:hypothetical protein